MAKAKANSDQDFNSDPGVVAAFLSTVIDMAQNNMDFATALLKDQNRHSLAALLEMVGYREYLATVDLPPPSQPVQVGIDHHQGTHDTPPTRGGPA